MPYILQGFAHLSAPLRAWPWCSAPCVRKTEEKTFPSLSSPSPCAPHSHTCHCSKPENITILSETGQRQKPPSSYQFQYRHSINFNWTSNYIFDPYMDIWTTLRKKWYTNITNILGFWYCIFLFLMIKDNLDIVDNLFILCVLFDYENVIDLDYKIFKEYIDFAHKCCFLGLLIQFYLW